MNQKIDKRRTAEYNKKISEEICEAIACSTKGLKALCEENEHWPCRDTIFRWRRMYKDFADCYARAKEHQVEALVDDILYIADNTSDDYTENNEGKKTVDHEHIQRSRVRIDTRKWIAAKLCPRLYGDKQSQDKEDSPHEKSLKELG